MGGRRQIVVGVVAAIAATLLMIAYAASVTAGARHEREQALARFGGEQIEVCVATRQIAAGETVESSDVEMRSWLVDLVPDGAATSMDQVVGQRASYPIARNEPVVVARVTAHDAELEVPQGLVAVTVPSDEVTAVGGSVLPGSCVDVYTTGSTGTSLLASQVLVLETSATVAGEGSSLSGGFSRGSVSWVTLAVDPSLVEQLVAVSRTGGLYLVLPGDPVPEDKAESVDAPLADETGEWVAGHGVEGDESAGGE